MLLILFLLPLQVLSGAMTPRESMPDIIQYIMLLGTKHPFRHPGAIGAFQRAGLMLVWPQLLALLAIGSTLFVLALRRFRRFLR